MKPLSFYTCFRFQGIEPRELHCTHKFLGRISEAEVVEVKRIVSEYFSGHQVSAFTPEFKEEAWFGSAADIRVLKTALSPQFLLDLKSRLDKFRPEDYAYNPHVTTPDREVVREPITSYALVANGVVVYEWVFS